MWEAGCGRWEVEGGGTRGAQAQVFNFCIPLCNLCIPKSGVAVLDANFSIFFLYGFYIFFQGRIFFFGVLFFFFKAKKKLYGPEKKIYGPEIFFKKIYKKIWRPRFRIPATPDDSVYSFCTAVYKICTAVYKNLPAVYKICTAGIQKMNRINPIGFLRISFRRNYPVRIFFFSKL